MLHFCEQVWLFWEPFSVVWPNILPILRFLTEWGILKKNLHIYVMQNLCYMSFCNCYRVSDHWNAQTLVCPNTFIKFLNFSFPAFPGGPKRSLSSASFRPVEIRLCHLKTCSPDIALLLNIFHYISKHSIGRNFCFVLCSTFEWIMIAVLQHNSFSRKLKEMVRRNKGGLFWKHQDKFILTSTFPYVAKR